MEHRAGEVRFSNVGDYDVTLAYEISDDARRYVSSVLLTVRPAGPPLSARGVQRARLGHLMERGAEQLTRIEGALKTGPVGPGARRARRAVDHVLPPQRGRRPEITPGELELTADAYREAARRGVGRRDAVQHALRLAGHSSSTGAVKRRIRLARERGLLPPAGSTRPHLAP